ncbi:MAG: Hpt domain-containing protein [Sulfitobacter sp.]|nr:Hpt domain-containing protein [Sulfitobacter sp.]
MIEWDQVRQLHGEVGPEDFEELVTLFLQEVDEVATRLEARGEPEKLQEDLHFLKGSAMNLGFADFAQACQRGETRAAKGDAAQVDLPKILELYRLSKSEFLQDLPTRLSPQTSL